MSDDNAGSGKDFRWYNPSTWGSKAEAAQGGGEPMPKLSIPELQSELSNMIMQDLLMERRSDRRWTWFKRLTISATSVVIFSFYVWFYVTTNTDFKIIPNSDIIGIVKIDGPIDGESMASANKVIPALKKAFESSKVKAVVLSINSPGGIPGESERINNIIDFYKEKTKKPVYAVITNFGASAAYLIALHADKIYACNFCLVGSIGAVIHGWDFHRVLEKVEVSQRVFASGELKDMLNPYVVMSPAAEIKTKSMVDAMAKVFADEVRSRRGNKLKGDVNYFTGEIWTAADAMKIGLIDDMGTLEDIVQKTWDIKTFDFGPEPEKRSFLKSLTSSFGGDASAEDAVALLKELLVAAQSPGVKF